MPKQYSLTEIFYSLQGEGMRTGEPSVFVRFAGCNSKCRIATHGFDCDTDFRQRMKMTAQAIAAAARESGGACSWVVLTGGEPGLQVDEDLLEELRHQQFRIAIETNGSIELPGGIDWITISPKGLEPDLKQLWANEVKYVRAIGQPIPETPVQAEHQLISPAYRGQGLDPETLAWCIQLVKENPTWRLSCQQHKVWKIA